LPVALNVPPGLVELEGTVAVPILHLVEAGHVEGRVFGSGVGGAQQGSRRTLAQDVEHGGLVREDQELEEGHVLRALAGRKQRIARGGGKS